MDTIEYATFRFDTVKVENFLKGLFIWSRLGGTGRFYLA